MFIFLCHRLRSQWHISDICISAYEVYKTKGFIREINSSLRLTARAKLSEVWSVLTRLFFLSNML